MGKSKTDAGSVPEWYVFAAGRATKWSHQLVTMLRTAWTKVRDRAKVVGRWHDNCHRLVTELSESGAGYEVIMSIAGHVSRAMLSRHALFKMEVKRRALDQISARQRAADEKSQKNEGGGSTMLWLLNRRCTRSPFAPIGTGMVNTMPSGRIWTRCLLNKCQHAG